MSVLIFSPPEQLSKAEDGDFTPRSQGGLLVPALIGGGNVGFELS